jgi:hypothetical protein
LRLHGYKRSTSGGRDFPASGDYEVAWNRSPAASAVFVLAQAFLPAAVFSWLSMPGG